MAYIRVPFADSGDKDEVPVASQSDGSVSYVQGYPTAYSLNPETDAAAKRIERTKMNQLFNDITAAIQEMQTSGVKPYITSDENGGSAFSYGLGALVMYNGVVYQSLTATNTQLPTVTANWSPVSNQANSVPVNTSAYVTGDLNTVISAGIYSVTAAATNAPSTQTAVLEVYNRISGGVVQVWHSLSSTAANNNRHFIRTGQITGGIVTSWSPWTQTTLRPTELSTGQDLNTLVESGVYYGGLYVNGPSPIAGAYAFVEVTSNGAGSIVKQVLHTSTANNRYQRTYASSAWTAWKQLVTSDDNPGRLLNIKVITSSGTYTPSNGTNKIIVELVGGGGGGAGAEGTTTNISGGSGGGGGGYAKLTTTSVPSTAVVTVGTGGARGNGQSGGSATNGSNGSSSSFGSLAVATGGSGGTYSTTPSASTLIQQLGGNCGTGTTGELLAYGQPGGKLLLTSSVNSTSGDGGASKFSFGPRGPGGGTAANGVDGRLGSGGSGAINAISQAAGVVGGRGGDGIVLIWEYA